MLLSLTPARARALVAVLRRHPDMLVIEDDSSGPIATAEPTSHGRWLPARTLHIRVDKRLDVHMQRLLADHGELF